MTSTTSPPPGTSRGSGTAPPTSDGDGLSHTMRAKNSVKAVLGNLICHSPFHRDNLHKKGVVVAFHRVNHFSDDLTCRAKDFDRFCNFFKTYFEVVSLHDMVSRLERGEDVRGCLAITFDDGYADNYEIARPILKAYELPATFFITSRFMGTDRVAWWDADKAHRKLRWMTWDEVRALHADGFTIGAHTRTHPNLGELLGEEARQEIVGARHDLEAQIGAPVDLFAYPFGGVDNFHRDNLRWVKEAGFRCCVSCHGGVFDSGSDPLQLQRVPIASSWYASPLHFAFEIATDRA